MTRESWKKRYEAYEKRCEEANSVEDPIKREFAFSECIDLLDELRQSPDAPKVYVPTIEEDIITGLHAAVHIHGSTLPWHERRQWWRWLEDTEGAPPVSENAELSRLREALLKERKDDPPLNDTQTGILVEMLAIQATADSPCAQEQIAKALNWKSHKRKFDSLQDLGYVKSSPHGMYLTKAGNLRAKRLSS